MNRCLSPTLIGYFPRRIGIPTGLRELRIPDHVRQICSAGHCGGASIEPSRWKEAWKHNELWVYDSEELAWSVIRESERAEFEIHAYRLYPVLFTEGYPAPVHLPNLQVKPLPDNYERIGYDAVSHPGLSTGVTGLTKELGHSSLSPLCNDACARIPVNRFCLLDTVEEAFQVARDFSAGRGGELEPYVVVEVLRTASKYHNHIPSERER